MASTDAAVDNIVGNRYHAALGIGNLNEKKHGR